VATVRVAVDGQVLASRLRAIALDTAFLAVIVLLMANELMALLGTLTLSQRLIDLDVQLVRLLQPAVVGAAASASAAATLVRPVLFVFMMAEELTRSFMPSYALSLVPSHLNQGPGWGSLPLVIFLGTVALCQLPFASLSVRLGRRKGLMWGALLAAAGYALSVWTASFWIFNGARLICALGFALVFVSAQGVVVDESESNTRTQSLAVFVRSILVAGMCGPPLGGLLADRWGVPAVFAVSAAMCLLALALACYTVPALKQGNEAPPWELGFAGLPPAWRSRPLRSLILGCALPAKLMLAATCFYLVPIGLAQEGYTRSEIGRFLMIYPFVMVVAIPMLAALASRLHAHRSFVIGGGVLAGAYGVLAYWPLSNTSVAAMLLMVGFGQAMSITSQTHIVLNLSKKIPGVRSSSVLGIFRLMERGGSALGPVAGAWLLGSMGLAPALAVTGFVVVAGNMTYAWISRLDKGGGLLGRPGSGCR
jgi:predicted MFS family arabinose efflux permease